MALKTGPGPTSDEGMDTREVTAEKPDSTTSSRIPPTWGTPLSESDYVDLLRSWIEDDVYLEPTTSFRAVQIAGRDIGEVLSVAEQTLKRSDPTKKGLSGDNRQSAP